MARHPSLRLRPCLDMLEDRCTPADLTVNTLTDPAPSTFDPDDGVLSLREAVQIANTNGVADTITFAMTGPITLLASSSLAG